MKNSKSKKQSRIRKAYALVMVLVVSLVLALLGTGILRVCLGMRVQATKIKRETVAMLAAEAGYEQGLYWMSQQDDVLTGLSNAEPGSSGTINFIDSRCNYQVLFHDFIGARPVFRILSNGYSGSEERVVDVYVMQKITGWDMGLCRIPVGPTSTNPVNFAGGEIIDIPVHINKNPNNANARDIYISGGSPQFMEKVEMGESRYAGATDLYGGIMSYFEGGIAFQQPDVKITNEKAVQSKVNRFRDSTKPQYRFTPVGTADLPFAHSAVQLEFFVQASTGMVKITNNCTVRGVPDGEFDYRIVPGSEGALYEKYDVYGFHYKPDNQASVIVPLTDTYVTQSFAGQESDPGGQIYVDGNVIIGSADYLEMVVEGKITIVATGNIWIADSIIVNGPVHGLTYVPNQNNPNVIGLISQSVIKIIDPGLSDNFGVLEPVEDLFAGNTQMHSYVPVANGENTTTNVRYLPDPTIVIAAITVGGGGWGAENVNSSYTRKEFSPPQDDLFVVGSISEAVRGIVGYVGDDGYIKKYTLDERLLEGVLPGNIWLGGKYIPAPAGWHDY